MTFARSAVAMATSSAAMAVRRPSTTWTTSLSSIPTKMLLGFAGTVQ